MALADIRDNLRDQMRAVAARVRETDVWLQMNEKYQSLSPAGQKASIAGVSLLFLLLVMAVPWSFYSSSRTSVEDFDSKRSTVRELFRVNREAASLPPSPPPVTGTELQNNARGALTAARLQPEQISAVTETASALATIPKSIDQSGIQVSLSKLNLRQIVDIGHDLQNLQGATGTSRMTGLEIRANVADPKYYDAIYRIVAFSAKPEPTADAKSKGRKK